MLLEIHFLDSRLEIKVLPFELLNFCFSIITYHSRHTISENQRVYQRTQKIQVSMSTLDRGIFNLNINKSMKRKRGAAGTFTHTSIQSLKSPVGGNSRRKIQNEFLIQIYFLFVNSWKKYICSIAACSHIFPTVSIYTISNVAVQFQNSALLTSSFSVVIELCDGVSYAAVQLCNFV